MFIIWGFGHKTVKRFTLLENSTCGRCNNIVNREVIKVTSWFTLFFIPLIPYSKKFYITCPICGGGTEISRDEYDAICQSSALEQAIFMQGDQNQTGQQPKEPTEEQKAELEAQREAIKYRGKTETQIAYLKQMEEFEKNKDSAD